MNIKKVLVTGLATANLLTGLPMVAQASEFQGEFPTEAAIVSVVDVENNDYITTRLLGNRVITRATALLSAPNGASLGNLAAGTRVQARGLNSGFVNVLVTSGANAGRTGWVSLMAIQ